MLIKPDLNLVQVVFLCASLGTFQFLQKELFSKFRKNILVPLEGTFWFLQKEPFSSFRRNFLANLERTFWFLQKELFSKFRENCLVPLERIFCFLQEEPLYPLKRNFLETLRRNLLVLLEGTFQTLQSFQKKLFRDPLKRNLLELQNKFFGPFKGLLNLLDHLHKKTPMPQSLFHYYQSLLYVLLYSL